MLIMVTTTCEVQVTSSHNILPLFFAGNAAFFSLHAESADLNDEDYTNADTAVTAQSLTMAAQPIEINLTAHAAQLTLPVIACLQCRSCHCLLTSRYNIGTYGMQPLAGLIHTRYSGCCHSPILGASNISLYWQRLPILGLTTSPDAAVTTYSCDIHTCIPVSTSLALLHCRLCRSLQLPCKLLLA